MTRWLHRTGLVLAALSLAPLAAQAQINQLLAQGERRTNENAQAQQRVESLADQAADLLAEYRTVTKVVEGLAVYNGLLQRQIDNQEAEKQVLEESIGKVSLIERQILPLMISMIDSLEEFIQLDVPFLAEERAERIDRLRTMMERSDVTAAEKFRRVIEAYQIEGDFGRTIESYKDSLEIDGQTLDVEMLRFGRVALLYQTINGDTGAWNNETRAWEALPPETYKKATATGIEIANKEKAPDLLVLPIQAAQGAGQ